MLNQFLNYVKLSSTLKYKLALLQFIFLALSAGVAPGWAAPSTNIKPVLTPEDVPVLLKGSQQAAAPQLMGGNQYSTNESKEFGKVSLSSSATRCLLAVSTAPASR